MAMVTSMQNDFCKYEAKDYNFVYQYIPLNSNEFSEIYDRLKIEMEKMMDMLNNGVLDQYCNV